MDEFTLSSLDPQGLSCTPTPPLGFPNILLLAQQSKLLAKKQQAVEQAYQETEAKAQRQLIGIEAAVDGIALLKNDRYQYLNSSHVRMFGYERASELVGQSWEMLYPPRELRRIQQEVIPQFRKNRVWRGEAIAQRKDGSLFYQGLSLTLAADNSGHLD